MKKRYLILLLLGIAFSIAVYFFACEKQQNKPDPVEDFKEMKMSMTLDSLYAMAGVDNLRAAADGIFDIIWLGDGFNQQNKYIFSQHCDHAENFLKVTYPFDSLWAANKLRFTRKLVTGNLNCNFYGFESLICNWDKVYRAAFANGLLPDFIHIFSLGNGFGTGNGGVSVLGIGTGMPGSLDQCYYWLKLPRMDGHEMGHGLGLDHAFIPTYPANLMSQATNGGCELGSTYLPKDHPTILNYIRSRIN